MLTRSGWATVVALTLCVLGAVTLGYPQLVALACHFEQPNGLAFAPDGRTLYVSDTALSLGEIPNAGTGKTHEIIAFDVNQAGALSNRRFFCHTDHGYPDGFTVDQRGWVWTSGFSPIWNAGWSMNFLSSRSRRICKSDIPRN